MAARFENAIPVLPAADVAASLRWWTEVCGFTEAFSHGEPPTYAGIVRDGVRLHLAVVSDPAMARTVGEQTMVRLQIEDLRAFFDEYQARSGEVHPDGGLEQKPWGALEFAAIDPCGVCVSFAE